MLQIGLVLFTIFLLQAVLTYLQMKHFSNEFVRLRRQGPVVCGRKTGTFSPGAVVLFLLNEEGIIQTGSKLEGLTCFARVKPLQGFEGRDIQTLTEKDGPKKHKNLCKAIADASLTYQKYHCQLAENTLS